MKAARSGKITEYSIDSAFEKTGLDAILQSPTVWGETARRLFEEWADIGRAGAQRGLDRVNTFLQCRTPHDFVALQGELLRDNMETVLDCARKAREHSTRLADEAERRFGNFAETMTSRRDEAGGQGRMTQDKRAHQPARRKSAHKRSAPVGGATARRRRSSR